MANVATLYTDRNAVNSALSVLTLTLDADYPMPDNYEAEAGVILVNPDAKSGTATLTYGTAAKGRIVHVRNTGATYSVTVKVSGQTGITIPAGYDATLLDNGTDFTVFGVVSYQN
jgi:hypothetical protein